MTRSGFVYLIPARLGIRDGAASGSVHRQRHAGHRGNVVVVERQVRRFPGNRGAPLDQLVDRLRLEVRRRQRAIADSSRSRARRASTLASSIECAPTWAITASPRAAPATAHASYNASLSSHVSEWHSPVDPVMKTVLIPFAQGTPPAPARRRRRPSHPRASASAPPERAREAIRSVARIQEGYRLSASGGRLSCPSASAICHLPCAVRHLRCPILPLA